MAKKKGSRALLALKIAAAGLLLGVAGFALWFYVSFAGDPISGMIAEREIRAYVAQTYPGMTLTVDDARYSFKTAAYSCYVHSPDSEDTAFYVTWKGGEIGNDSYAWDVKGGLNTFARIDRVVDEAVEAIVAREFSHPADLVIATLQDGPDGFSSLTLDMQVDIHDPPLPIHVTIWIQPEDDPAYDTMAERLLELRALMDAHGIPVAAYSMMLDAKRDEDGGKADPAQDVAVFDFPADEVIDDGTLAERLEQHHRAWEEEHDGVKERERMQSGEGSGE